MNSANENGLRNRALFGWVALAIWIATFILFTPTQHFQFVNYDDFTIAYQRPQVYSGISRANFIWAFSSIHADFAYWMPLTWLTHQLDFQLFKHHAGFHHLTNVLLHSINTVLVFTVLFRLKAGVWGAAAISALFAWHPQHVESVAWISERKSLVSFLFWMLATIRYVRFVETRSACDYILVCLCFVAALMGKPMAVTLPFSLLLLDFWPLRRIGQAATRGSSRLAIYEKVPLFAISIIGSAMAYFAQNTIGAVHSDVDYWYRFTNAIVSYWLYIYRTFWPASLIPLYPRESNSAAIIVWSTLFVATITAVAFRQRHRRAYLWVGWCWYVGNLMPSIGIVPIGDHASADRYTYLPLLGIFVIIVGAGAEFASRRQVVKQSVSDAVLVSFILALLILPLRTLHQISYWRDGVTLFSHAVEVNPLSGRIHCVLAANLAVQNDYAFALRHIHEALKIQPRDVQTLALAGDLCAATGDQEKAVRFYKKALVLNPNYRQALFGLAQVLSTHEASTINEGVEAVCLARRLCSITGNRYPRYIGVLGRALAASGEWKEARLTTEKALALADKLHDAVTIPSLSYQLDWIRRNQPLDITEFQKASAAHIQIKDF